MPRSQYTQTKNDFSNIVGPTLALYAFKQNKTSRENHYSLFKY